MHPVSTHVLTYLFYPGSMSLRRFGIETVVDCLSDLKD